MKLSTRLWVSILLIAAFLSSACALSEMATENQSEYDSSQPDIYAEQPDEAALPGEAAPSEEGQDSASLPGDPRPWIALVGDPKHSFPASQVIEAAGDYQVSVNESIDSADLVLFFISAADGVVPATLQQIDFRVGETFPRAAFLVTSAEVNLDLRSDFLLDFRKSMAEYLPGGQAESWQMLFSNDPAVVDQIASLLATPEQTASLQFPDYVQPPGRDVSPDQTQIVMVGDYHGGVNTAQAVQAVEEAGNYHVSVNYPVGSADLVLFFVSALNGPMPRTRLEIGKRAGEQFTRAAFLVTDVEMMDDPELIDLVVLEYREILTGYLQSGDATNWPVLYSNSPDLTEQIASLVIEPEGLMSIRRQADQPAPANNPPAPDPNLPRRIVLVGDRQAAEQALPLITASGNYEVLVNSPLDPSDLVLFAVSAADGPMPNTLTEIENRVNEPFPRAAFLLTDDDLNPDPELHDLVLLEMREILSRYLPGGEANAYQVLLSTGPDLPTRLHDLLNGPEQITVLQAQE